MTENQSTHNSVATNDPTPIDSAENGLWLMRSITLTADETGMIKYNYSLIPPILSPMKFKGIKFFINKINKTKKISESHKAYMEVSNVELEDERKGKVVIEGELQGNTPLTKMVIFKVVPKQEVSITANSSGFTPNDEVNIHVLGDFYL